MADKASTEDILYLGDVPVLLRLNLLVDGKPWHKARGELTKRQFKLLDTDKDGLLEVDQLTGVPLPGFDASEAATWDTDKKDGKLSESEFLQVFETHSEPAFLLAEGVGQASSRIKLFPHLDVNEDGKLTKTEFAQARQHLARLDYDDDETISTTELAPFANPLFQQGFVGRETPLAESAPFLSVGSFESKADLATALLRRYGANEKEDESEREIDSISCKLSDLGANEELAKFDVDKNGLLNHGEVTRYLKEQKPDIVLQIEMPSRQAKRPKIKLLADEIKASKKRPSKIRGSSRMELRAAKTVFDVRTQSSQAMSSDNRNFYMLEFLRADADKNSYLEPMEFGAMGLNAPFATVDVDGDEKVVRDELSAYLERDAFISQSQIVLSVAADTRTLFHVMDVNVDQRLAMREFKEIGDRLKYLDKNGDNTIERNEISHEYRLLFSMGRPRVFQQAMSQANNSNAPAPRATPNEDAPDWFRKMDRNQDGDLSWREFLGRRDTFDKLDADHDGLVSVAEIESVN